ncbi:MAG: adenylate/guanylate cyclase domain-containing protein [Saprospiraceae bacterium]|nr:adenylate/guanylate cyclase domain-containing protein [Saprospiraceae bacterium]
MKSKNTSVSSVDRAVIRQMWTPHTRLPQKRYEAIVMFTDVVGFSRVMHEDEENAIIKLEKIRRLIERHHANSNGRIIQYYGDGCLSVFDNAADALHCAIAIQGQSRKQEILPLRIGIHGGDIVEKDGAIYGDVVNIAARVEAAGAEGVILVSNFVRQKAKGAFDFMELGRRLFKNIDAPVVIHAVRHAMTNLPPSKTSSPLQRAASQLLRFASMMLA